MMMLITVASHQGEGEFPLFHQGTRVNILAECIKYKHWLSAEIAGYQVYVPRHFIMQNQLTRDYNPTELVVRENEIVELLERHYEWALVRRGGEIGWLPCEILTDYTP